MPANVVVIILDALRADRVGTLGGRELTPNIDSLASEATVFQNAFSTTNATDSAVTTIETGKYPLSHGIINHGRHVSDEEMQTVEQVSLLQEQLSEAGYRTAKFGRPLGRWHRRGFDIYPEEMEKRTAFDVDNKEEETVRARIRETLNDIHPIVRDIVVGAYNTANHILAEYTDDATEQDSATSDPDRDEILEMLSEFLDKEGPFYAFVHLMDTHTPYVPDPDLVREYLEKFEYDVEKINDIDPYVSEEFHQRVVDGDYPEVAEKYYYGEMTPTSAVVDAHYDAAVRETDERVGAILKELQDHGCFNETLLMVLSDHGESLVEHGIYWDHHGLYDQSVHVPLLVRPPGGTDGEVTDLVQLTDLVPTIASYTDLDDLDTDGESLKPAIEAEKAIDREYVLAEEALYQRKRMIRTEDKKLIYSLDDSNICRLCDVKHAPETELYDLSTDPAEMQNCAEERGSDVSTFREYAKKEAQKYRNSAPNVSPEEAVTYEDEQEVEERLEALGYR